VSFEIIGMLGQVVRLRGSNFRMVPNPTHDHWRKNIGRKASWKITRLMEVFQNHLQKLIISEQLGAEHQAVLISKQWGKISKLDCTNEANLSIECREAIHDSIEDVTSYLLNSKQTDVLSVLVSHISSVVDVLDNPNSPLNTIALTNANKEETLFTYYFDNIRPAVVRSSDSMRNVLDNNSVEREQRSTIWVSLMFRMLCWLLIHDFDKADVRVVPSDLKGSRMPVFIG